MWWDTKPPSRREMLKRMRAFKPPFKVKEFVGTTIEVLDGNGSKLDRQEDLLEWMLNSFYKLEKN